MVNNYIQSYPEMIFFALYKKELRIEWIFTHEQNRSHCEA